MQVPVQLKVPARGARDAALGQHSVEHQKQVQIDRRKAHDT